MGIIRSKESHDMEILYILALAFLLDFALGDPPNIIHPVAWMGKVISLTEKIGLKLHPAWQFIYGIIITLFTTALFSVLFYFLLNYLWDWNRIAYIIVGGILLKLMFSMRGLWQTARKIKLLLQEEKLEKTRFELRALVSRDTHDLDESLMASAATESIAEGICDSVIAPLFYFLLLGIPGAIGYRVVNTLDSMIGYHGKYEYLGKFGARFDDVLNFIPARLTALVICVAAIFKKKARSAWRTALQEHAKTESPNAGWPMAAMAGSLGVRLEKPGYYILGEGNPTPSLETIRKALNVFFIALFIWTAICFITGGIRIAITT
jgi:adenosylcobinamide-phosphate synthase